MEVVFILIAISTVVAIAFLGAFLWAVRSGQFEDSNTPAIRILLDKENKNKS